ENNCMADHGFSLDVGADLDKEKEIEKKIKEMANEPPVRHVKPKNEDKDTRVAKDTTVSNEPKEVDNIPADLPEPKNYATHIVVIAIIALIIFAGYLYSKSTVEKVELKKVDSIDDVDDEISSMLINKLEAKASSSNQSSEGS
ncbi:hypothetical protein ACFLZN_02170, partial [Nanoarchaeota archaeon]